MVRKSHKTAAKYNITYILHILSQLKVQKSGHL